MTNSTSGHPKGLYVLFFTEMWERFGFYTMSAIFLLYLEATTEDGGLALPGTESGSIYGLFMGLVYFTPLAGGWIADRLTGERVAISIGAVFLAAGYFMLAVPPGEGLVMLYVAMGAVWIGNGLFKPNISTMVGKLYPHDSPLRDAGFNIFYTGINLGATAAPFAASFLRTNWSWHAAFGAAGVGMIISLIIFTVFRGVYAGELVDGEGAAQQDADAEEDADAVGFGGRMAALGILLLVSTAFWTLFFQNGSALTRWAKNCTDRPEWLTPELFQAINPMCIVVLSLAAAWLWRRMGEAGNEPSIPDKILLGLVVAIGACGLIVVAALSGGNACPAAKVSMMWLVLTYVLISLGEILVSPMGLSYCTKVAPKDLGGLVMGGWFVSLSAGGWLSGKMFSRFWEAIPHSTYFGILAGLLVLVAVLLMAVRGVLRRAAE